MWKTNPALLLCACREKFVCEMQDVKQWSTRLTVWTMLTKWTTVWPINVDGHPWVDVVVQRMTVTLDVNIGHPFGWPLGWLEVDLKLTFGWPSWSRSTRPHSSPLFVGIVVVWQTSNQRIFMNMMWEITSLCHLILLLSI